MLLLWPGLQSRRAYMHSSHYARPCPARLVGICRATQARYTSLPFADHLLMASVQVDTVSPATGSPLLPSRAATTPRLPSRATSSRDNSKLQPAVRVSAATA